MGTESGGSHVREPLLRRQAGIGVKAEAGLASGSPYSASPSDRPWRTSVILPVVIHEADANMISHISLVPVRIKATSACYRQTEP